MNTNDYMKLTPPLDSKGIFKVRHPFRVGEKKVYEVIAIREFPDLHAEHINIYELYYRPEGLTEEDYKRDLAKNAAIVSLMSNEGVIYIPDTYILSYPELGLANYHNVILSVSLGPISRNYNLNGVMSDIRQVVSKMIGVEATVKIHTSDLTEGITVKESLTLEKIRKGKIDVPETAENKLRKERRRIGAVVDSINNSLLKRFKKKK